MSQKAYLTLSHGPQRLGTLRLLIAGNVVPRTARNFLTLLTTDNDSEGGYRNSTLHRIIRGFMAQGGDFTNGDGTGGRSIYGATFDDENFVLSHDERGVLSMANSGPDTNGSQFFITFRPVPHLDGRHVVFGRVDLTDGESREVLDALERVGTGREDRPRMAVTIVDCGVTDEEEDGSAVQGAASKRAATAGVGTSLAMDDNDEIDLDDDDDDDEDDDGGVSQQRQEQAPVPVPAAGAVEKDSDEIDIDEEDDHVQEKEEEEASPPKNSKAALQARLRKLKMKMNQSRQLNRREVQSEGERLGSSEGAAQHRRQQAKKDRDSRNKEWEVMSSRAADSAASAAAAAAGVVDDVDTKKLNDQASDVLRKAQRKADRAASNRYGINDYYNSEGQQRNYERSLKSVPRGMTEASSAATAGLASGAVYDPLTHQLDADSATYDGASSERAGARRLASELHRRQAKTEARRKRKSVEFDAADVSGINQRNKRFNEKISRNFDAHTAEIRQNLERGTAL